jgi:hypothetical protein
MKKIRERQSLYQISHKREDSKLIIHLSEEFGLRDLTAFAGEIQSLLEQHAPVHEVELDFSSVSFHKGNIVTTEIKKQNLEKNSPA